jgi:hypothetical protein
MAAPRLVDDRLVQRADVVGAEQPQRGVLVDGAVQQCFVQLAFRDFFVPASRPDGFTDPAHRPARRALDEFAPRRDDPCRVVAQLGHVDEVDPLGVRTQRLPHCAEPRLDDRHHHCLVQLETRPEERDHHREELVDAVVEDAFMPVRGRRAVVRGRDLPVRA